MYKVLRKSELECDNLVKALNDVVETYGCATINDLFELIGEEMTDSEHERNSTLGWVVPVSLVIEKEGDAFCLLLPTPLPVGIVESKPDMVNHPSHYQSKNGLEVIHVIEAFTDKLHGIEATDTGNVIKYILRWHEKNGLEDLKKARWYLEHLINHIEKENDKHE